MRVEIVREPKFQKIDHLFVILAEGEHLDVTASVKAIAKKAVAAAKFTGRTDESITMLSNHPKKVTLLGLGKKASLSIRGLRGALYSVAKIAKKQRDKNIAVLFPYALPTFTEEETLRLTADYLSGTDYKYDRFITVKKDEKAPSIHSVLIAPSSADAKQLRNLQKSAIAVSDGVRTVRDLGNAPSNIVTPTTLAERAVEIANELGIKCTVYGRREIQRMKMGGLIAVNRGSIEEPKFIVLEYAPPRAKKHVALVGKGITFDSGGISIKPAERMEEMKFDMCGAAAVIGTIEAAAKLGLPVKISGFIPSTDNLPSGSAYKPGEIITMMSGKTVEIVNTDAEGRMILGDALHYASLRKPDHLIDYATLTGACVVALGGEASGLFSNDDELARKLIECGDRVGDRLWRMPVWDEYKELIRSEWADMKNSGGRVAGAISATMFLKEFVTCPSWAHLDIAGTAWAENENAREAKGATGVGVRATVRFLEELT